MVMSDILNEERSNLEIVKKEITSLINVKSNLLSTYEGTKLTQEEREEFISISNKNHRINKSIEDLQGFLNYPYFARLGFNRLTNNSIEPLDKIIYVGMVGQRINDKIIVVDWRSPVGQIYYTSNQTRFYVAVDKIKNNYNLILKRKILIKSGQIVECQDIINLYNKSPKFSEEIDSKDKIIDEFLLKIIEDKRLIPQVSNIISTIQENQNKIITSSSENSFIVQGCPGSGKTMILLHRLSYLLFNKHINQNNMIIISPSKSFIKNLNNLSIELGLGAVLNLPLTDFYFYTSKKYDKNFACKEEIDSEYEISKEFLKIVYSKDFFNKLHEKFIVKRNRLYNELTDLGAIQMIENKYYSISDDFLNEKKYYETIKSYNEMLSSIREKIILNCTNMCDKFYSNILPETDIPLDFFTLKEIYTMNNAYKKTLLSESVFDGYFLSSYIDFYKTLSFEFLDDRIYEKINSIYKSTILKSKKLIKEYEKELVDMPREQTYENSKNKFEVNRKIDRLKKYSLRVARLNKFFNAIKNKDFETVITLGEMLVHWFDMKSFEWLDGIYDSDNHTGKVDYSISLLNASLKYNDVKESLFEEVDNLIVHYNVPIKNSKYKFQIYLDLVFKYLFYGPLNFEQNKLFSIDEFQDIAANEINLLYLIYPNSKFNLYGDCNQNTHPAGFNIESGYSKKFITYNLSENYRNTSQINDFINGRLDYNNISLGLNGKDIEQIDLNHLISHVKMFRDKRVAIIFSRNNQEFFLKLKSKYKDLSDITFFVDEVKGNEYDLVYVCDSLMSKNERYIAYSRGLVELYIVNCDLI